MVKQTRHTVPCKQFNVYIPVELVNKTESYAFDHNITKSAVVEQAIKEFFVNKELK